MCIRDSGYDAVVSFRSLHHRGTGTTCTVISSTGDGAWVLRDLQDAWVRETG